MKKISLLGSTGSIGLSTLDLVRRYPQKFKIVGLAAGSNLEVLASQIKEFNPEVVSVRSEEDVQKLRILTRPLTPSPQGRGNNIEIVWGVNGAVQVSTHPDAQIVVSAIVGAAGLIPTLQAIKLGKTIGLANKESMVIAGEIMCREAKKSGSVILPIDSEHSALFQCLNGNRKEDLEKLVLTASGGPFLNKPFSEFVSITVEQALRHPNWSMGSKITIDSATMMNKGLEVMEARWLFDVPVEQIDVCVHPQSIIHSFVSYKDGSTIAQLGLPDMRVPIAYALSYPERVETGVKNVNLWEKKELTFFEPDFQKFKCLKIAFDVARQGQSYPAVLNAANEIVVEAFLKGKIAFTDIAVIIDKVLQSHKAYSLRSLEDVLQADEWGRAQSLQIVKAN